jgi:hypothetical protein
MKKGVFNLTSTNEINKQILYLNKKQNYIIELTVK